MSRLSHLYSRRALRIVAAPILASALAAGAAPAAQAVPVGGLPQGLKAFVLTPNRAPGANDWSCKPSAAHPRPVVLAHGTMANMGFNWPMISPMLKNAGYCVFALNYGMTKLSLGGRLGGLGDIDRSASELAAFVDRVIAATGAETVDLVGHSLGGMMPHAYLRFQGGAAKVHKLIGLAPSNHGTDVNGLVRLIRSLPLIGQPLLNLYGRVMITTGTRGLQQQLQGDAFQRRLWADGDTMPGVKYTVISTRYDNVVTPWRVQFLDGPNAENILIQDLCPRSRVGHAGLALDLPAMQIVLNELGADDPAFKPECRGYGPPL